MALPIYILKSISRQKKELQKLIEHFPMQKYNLQKKKPLKETKILQDIMRTL
jgi:hypothetical protein